LKNLLCNGLEQYKTKLDSLFSAGSVAPFVIVGTHSNEKEVPINLSYRNYEYSESFVCKDNNDDLCTRFERHLNFFVYEVDEYMREQRGLKINKRHFYGVSNGGAFGVSLAKYYPDLFSKYILYSSAGLYYKKLKWNREKYPFLIIRYGEFEIPLFIDNNVKFCKYLSKKKYQHICETFQGGHDREWWMNLFIEDLKKL
jgi:enterochelin esterase-like enzyme